MQRLDPVAESQLGSTMDRVVAGVVLLAAALFVAFLLSVIPDPRGHGTHEQFGMSRCGWVVRYGKPCPTCGVTTSAALLVRLRLIRAVAVQPFGTALAAFGLWVAGVAAWCLIRGRSYFDFLQRLPLIRILLWGLVLLLASWAYVYWTFPT